MLFYILFVLIVLFYVLVVLIVLYYVLFVCKYVPYYCHRVTTKLQLTNISIFFLLNISIDFSLSCRYSEFSFGWELFFKCYIKKFQLSEHYSKRQNLCKFVSAAPSDFCPSANVEVLPVGY